MLARMNRSFGLILLAMLAACGGNSDDVADATTETSATTGDTTTAGDTATDTAGDTTDTTDDGTDTTGGEPAATFAEVQAQVFDTCSGFGPMTCHQSVPFGGGLDLTAGNSYASLVNAPAAIGGVRVTPGSLEDSVLWRKLTNDLAMDGTEGEPMPKGEAISWQELPAEQMDLVSSWILGGAKP
jgi:hypothetical protein